MADSSGAPKYVCSLSPELVVKAEKELNEKAQWRARDVQALRDMVLAHKGLKSRTDDAFLLRFLRARKFDYDRAYQLIVNYFQVRAQNKEIFKDLKPSTILPILDDGVAIVLPHADKNGSRLIYFRPGQWDVTNYDIWSIFRMINMCLEKLIEDEATQVNGFRMIGDMGTVGWNQAKNVTPSYARLLMQVMQEAFPARFKGMHLVHEPAFFTAVFAIIKPFMKEKLQSRMNFYGNDLKSLHKTFDPSILPEELGGQLGPADKLKQDWNKELTGSEAMFEDLLQYSIELDRKIVSQAGSDSQTDCLVGTYRKLNID